MIFFELIFHFWSQKGGIHDPHIYFKILLAGLKPNRHVRAIYWVLGYLYSENYLRFEKSRHFEKICEIYGILN